jgi:DNA-binding FadR family transcriptional regulator
LIGRLASERITDDQLREIRNIQEECKNLPADENIRQFMDIDIKFREVLNNSADNPTLKEISDCLYNQTMRVWYMVFEKNNFSTELVEEMKEIEKTIEVLSQKDPQKAEAFRRNVIIKYVERVKDKF